MYNYRILVYIIIKKILSDKKWNNKICFKKHRLVNIKDNIIFTMNILEHYAFTKVIAETLRFN